MSIVDRSSEEDGQKKKEGDSHQLQHYLLQLYLYLVSICRALGLNGNRTSPFFNYIYIWVYCIYINVVMPSDSRVKIEDWFLCSTRVWQVVFHPNMSIFLFFHIPFVYAIKSVTLMYSETRSQQKSSFPRTARIWARIEESEDSGSLCNQPVKSSYLSQFRRKLIIWELQGSNRVITSRYDP